MLSPIFLLTTITLVAQEKTFVREYTYKANEMDSKLSCRSIAINQLRSTLLNEVGVYVESESILKTTDVNGKFSQDFVENIATISAGITKLVVLDETWNGQLLWMKAAITIDTTSLGESLKQLANDRQRVREMKELSEKLNSTLKELDNVKRDLAAAANGGNHQVLNQKYGDQIKRLNSVEYSLIAKARVDKSDWQAAMANFTKAIELDPHCSLDFAGRGLSKFHLNDDLGAMTDYSRAIELDPNSPLGYAGRGSVKYELADYRGALMDFTKAIEIDSEIPVTYFGRGTSKAQLGEYEGAIEDFTKAIELDPKQAAPSYQMRGYTKSLMSDYVGAIVDYSKAIEMDPRKSSNYLYRGAARMLIGDFQLAKVDFTKAIELDKYSGDAYFQRGLSQMRLGQKASGCLDFHKAIELGFERAHEGIRRFCN